MDDGSPRFDHLVFALLSRVFCGKCPSLPVAPTAVMVGILQSVGFGVGPGGNPAFIPTLVILAQLLFSLFAVTVILKYLAVTSVTSYRSADVDLPLLFPEKMV